MKVTVKILSATHTHEGVSRSAGDVIELDDWLAAWLIDQGVVVQLSGIIATPIAANVPVSLNDQSIRADLEIDGIYNALSAGPIEIVDGVVVAVGDGSNWSVY